ncbi:MAG: hypothetical protein JY451_13090 [Erythrobacter sp.]|nr:MAG: hypothetical protein JY451_13090 [Erythrobacter sp.]
MLPGTWPNPPGADEYAVRLDSGRALRLLIVPALFDEANKLRHFTVETMRSLDAAGVDCLLPDLPGTNESLADLQIQTLASWRAAMAAAAAHFAATHLLTVRAGALCAPEGLPCLHYAPVAGASVLRALLRARVIADREAGLESSREALLDQGKRGGLVLAGYSLGAALISELEKAELAPGSAEIAQAELGGPGLWLRAEPDHDPAQTEALARIVRERIG